MVLLPPTDNDWAATGCWCCYYTLLLVLMVLLPPTDYDWAATGRWCYYYTTILLVLMVLLLYYYTTGAITILLYYWCYYYTTILLVPLLYYWCYYYTTGEHTRSSATVENTAVAADPSVAVTDATQTRLCMTPISIAYHQF